MAGWPFCLYNWTARCERNWTMPDRVLDMTGTGREPKAIRRLLLLPVPDQGAAR